MSQRGITLYLHVHQPWRIRKYSIFDTARTHDYFDEHEWSTDRNNQQVFEKVAAKSYRPMNELLERLLAENPDFKLSLSITGTFIEQAQVWAPDVLESFQRLVRTGRVEIAAETYYHSMAFFYSQQEFDRQVEMHHQMIVDTFGIEPKVFRNTELAYNDDLAKWADKKGYKGILAEGWDPILEWRSPNYIYRPTGTDAIRLLVKNYRLSDDIAFRFGNKDWEGWPLTAEKYTNWARSAVADGSTLNLFMDYETFGEHQWADTGIFSFFENFVSMWLAQPGNTFYTLSEALDSGEPAGELSMPNTVTWADSQRDMTAWTGNGMQREALRHLYSLEQSVMRSGDIELIEDWRKLQTSDHAYYMSTKWETDGDVHTYFSPYDSPYDAFLYYMNALRDIRYRVMAYHHHEGLHG
jgi:alpha-amylase